MRRWTDHLTRAPLVAACLVLLLFLAGAPTALAVPTLTATPTEVTFNSTTEVQATMLTWNSGSAESVQVHVKVDNGSFAPTGLAGPFGQTAYSIKYGKTYTFRLFGANGRTIVGARDVVVTTKLKKVDLEFGCALECIREVVVDPHGTFADFTAATSTDATFIVQAFSAPPKSDGTCPSAPLAGTLWKPTPSKVFSGQMLHLDAGTLHCFTVTAKDAGGNEQKVHKTFSTHKRFVTVTIDEIFIQNDSDDGGLGEIGFDVTVHNQQDVAAVPQKDIGTAGTIHPNKQYTVADAPTTVKLYVYGYDDDAPFDVSEVGWAETLLDVGGPGGPGETFGPKTFTLQSTNGNSGSDLSFKVSGTFSVTYAP